MNNQLRILFAISLLAVIIFLGVLLFSFFSSPKKAPQTTGNTPISKNNLTPLQKTIINEPFGYQSKDLGTPKNKQILPNGTVKYEYSSVQPTKNDEIITKDGTVVSETTITQTGKNGPLPRLSSYQALYGQPQEIVRGNKIFGEYADAHIYASQGVMLIVNRFTTEVYLIQRFAPLSLTEYKKIYPNYIESVIDEGV